MFKLWTSFVPSSRWLDNAGINPPLSRVCDNNDPGKFTFLQSSQLKRRDFSLSYECQQGLLQLQFVCLQQVGSRIHFGDPHVFDRWCVILCATGPTCLICLQLHHLLIHSLKDIALSISPAVNSFVIGCVMSDCSLCLSPFLREDPDPLRHDTVQKTTQSASKQSSTLSCPCNVFLHPFVLGFTVLYRIHTHEKIPTDILFQRSLLGIFSFCLFSLWWDSNCQHPGKWQSLQIQKPSGLVPSQLHHSQLGRMRLEVVCFQQIGARKHLGDPHVSDRWCVILCATEPICQSRSFLYTPSQICSTHIIFSYVYLRDVCELPCPAVVSSILGCVMSECNHCSALLTFQDYDSFQGDNLSMSIRTVFMHLTLFEWLHHGLLMQLVFSLIVMSRTHNHEKLLPNISYFLHLLVAIVCLTFIYDNILFFSIAITGLTLWHLPGTPFSPIWFQLSHLQVKFVFHHPCGVGFYNGDPHVFDRWCVTCCTTDSHGGCTRVEPQDIHSNFVPVVSRLPSLPTAFWHYAQLNPVTEQLNLFQALRGIRIGEAKNPGPSTRRPAPTAINLAVINPTAVLNKVSTFVSLRKQFNIHLFALSETSATSSAQTTLSKQFAAQKLTVNWSPPVPPQRDTLKCDRGKASGTAIISAVPMRPCRHKLPDPWQTNTRLNRAIVQIGQSHFQVWTVYGFSSSQPRSKERTNELLSFVFSQLDNVPLPFVICGDFNAEVTHLPIWTSFAQKGACDLAQIHNRLYGVTMPMTCHQATRPDSAIVSKDIVPLIQSIQVLPATWFSVHAPVVFSIKLPQVALFRHHFTLPRSFMEFAPTKQDLAEAHQKITGHNPPPTTLEEWGFEVESTVDQWLAYKGPALGIPSALPRAFRGRCTELKLQSKPVVSNVRSGRQGDYEPPDEILSHKTKRKVKQHRRIESLLRRLNANPLPHLKGNRYFSDLCQEWLCILRSNCYGPPFAKWLADIPEIGYPQWPLPSVAYLHDVLQYSKYTLEQTVATDRKVYQEKAKFAAKLDRQHMGSKQAFSQIRGAPKSPINSLRKQVVCQAQATWDEIHHTVDLVHPDLAHFQSSTPFLVEGSSGKLYHYEEGHITFVLDNMPETCSDTAQVTQCTELCDPEEVADHLSTYWMQWWQNTLPPISDHATWDFDADLQHLPELPTLDIDLTLEALKRAISKLKTNSARGLDSISAYELQTLPDSLLEQLLCVFRTYDKGFPSWFMRARTFPLRKCDGTPEVHQTRPITVLSQLYRLWGALICSQILLQWQYLLPKGITGMLPSRGSHMAAYAAQLGIEFDHYQGKQSTGLTLDLRKCFNLISHQAGRRLLLAAGIPRVLVEQWISSIRALTRFWEIESSHYGPVHSNNGFPEGDIWSVVVMIAIGLHWIATLEAQMPEHIQCSAYADNWGWKSHAPSANVDAALATCAFLLPYGLQIDWDKTWCWGTSTALAKQVQQLLQQALPEHPIAILSHSRDLGFELQYSGAHRIGHRITRYDEGFRRLSKLEHLKVDLVVKEHLVTSSVWPAALYGSEIYPPSGELLQKFASKAADALLGHSKAMSPSIALLLLGSQILDPGFVCIRMALRAARAWLLQCNQEECLRYYHLVATFNGRSHEIKGPAATLKHYLRLIDWQLDKKGFLQVAPFQKVHIILDSWQRIDYFLQLSWQKDLVTTKTHRTSLFGIADISRQDTVSLLTKFPDQQRRNLVREIAGAFQAPNQKIHWIEDPSQHCAFCTGTDSKHHRLCECPAFSEIRAPYLEMLSEIESNHPSLLEFPVVHVHPDSCVHQHLQYQEPRAIFSESVQAHVIQRDLQGEEPIQFFTDGSCSHPEHSTTRYSSFAIVMDICTSDIERRAQIDRYEATGAMPTTLVLIAAARAFGEQTINRAELMAVTEIVRHVPKAVIYSDSAYSCSAVDECFNSTQLADVSKCANLDLHLELLQALTPRHKIYKIAAHQTISQLGDALSKYRALGNQMANDHAISTCLEFNKPWQQQLEQRHCEVQCNRDFTCALFNLHTLLGDARAAAEKQLDRAETASSGAHFGAQDTKQQLISWAPQATLHYDSTDIRDELQEYFCWGSTWAGYFSEWLQQLGWDTTGGPPTNEEIGVTWLELALSYMLYSKHWIPCLRQDNDDVTTIVFPRDDNHADTLSYQATDAAVTFSAMWTQYHSLLLDKGPVPLVRGLQKSLVVLGAKCRCSGFQPRPHFPFHAEVVQLAADLMSGRTSYKFTLKMPCELGHQCHFESLIWDQRKSHLKFGQARSRCLKRTLGD